MKFLRPKLSPASGMEHYYGLAVFEISRCNDAELFVVRVLVLGMIVI